ncbi:hypothetical protein [Caulobacter phage Cr30]|nr:hypothetical protein OZ74_gp202 [Caulobacter phage Cr30]AGS81141.1 hypothetical protein [Caulobacter phage Cr30]
MSNKINKDRSSKIQGKSTHELKRIAASGSLSRAAAEYELRKRGEIA